MNGGGRKEDGFVTIVMLETVTRNELEKVLKVSYRKKMVVAR